MSALALALTALAQNGYQVKGVVIDALGPVVGATVMEQGTTVGTSTGLDGDYTLTVSSADATVEISCIGYASQTYKASELPATVTLSEDAVFLDDVVVIGYGSQKKKEVTGAVSSIKSEDFNAGVKTNPMGLLQGKVAGLNIIKTTSDPTSTGYNIQIRGFSTLDKGAGTSPLYIVDGVPVSNIDNISPDEIASMDVLKDGSAAAIYGTRGTNGVIIITTKRGDNFSDVAHTRVEYSGYASASFRNGDLGMATPDEYRRLAELSDGMVKPAIFDGDYNTDWLKEVTRTAAIAHNHNVAIVGSAKKFNYRASINYKNAEGIARNTNRNEMIAKLAASQKALDGWLELQYDMSYMHYRNDYFCGDFKYASLLNPTYPIYDETTATGYYFPTETGAVNPVENMNRKESYGDGNYFRGSVKATVNIKPVTGLKVNAFGAIEEGDNRSFAYNHGVNTDLSGSGTASRDNSMSYSRLLEITADYTKTFGSHNIALVGGFSWQNFLYDGSSISNKGFPTDDAKYYQIGNGDATKQYLNVSSYRNSNTLAALFFRANYNFKEKYLLSASIRREGSSRFGANHKWGWFPAVSAGWRVSGEPFMENVGWVDDLKVRLGFGVTGNNLASDLRSIEMLSNGGTFWYNGQYVYTYAVAQNVNPDLKWETTTTWNAGLDFGFLNNRISANFDTYYRKTTDLLNTVTIPVGTNFGSVLTRNIGSMKNYGIEFSINAKPIVTKDFTWDISYNISWNHNEITSLTEDAEDGYYIKTGETISRGNGTLIQANTVGKPRNSFFVYQQVYDANGKPIEGMYVDRNADGQINESDRYFYKSPAADVIMGFTTKFLYKKWDFSAAFYASLGNYVYYDNLSNRASISASGLYSNSAFTNTNPEAVELGFTGLGTEYYLSDYFVRNASYLKCSNITVGYSFDNLLKDHFNGRVFATVQNPFIITKYKGIDPEVSSGVDKNPYPRPLQFQIGLNLNF